MTEYLETEIEYGTVKWYSISLTFPQGLCICDALYHGSGFHLPSITSVQKIGVLEDRNANVACIIFSAVEIEPSKIEFLDWAEGGCGSQLMINGTIPNEEESDTVTNDFYDSETTSLDGLQNSVFKKKIIRGQEAVLIETFAGTGGFGLYKYSQGYILEFIGYQEMSEDDYEDYLA